MAVILGGSCPGMAVVLDGKCPSGGYPSGSCSVAIFLEPINHILNLALNGECFADDKKNACCLAFSSSRIISNLE